MAEPKRHRDVPQGACFGKYVPSLRTLILINQEARRRNKGMSVSVAA